MSTAQAERLLGVIAGPSDGGRCLGALAGQVQEIGRGALAARKAVGGCKIGRGLLDPRIGSRVKIPCGCGVLTLGGAP
jgi:hypothetical protein